MTNLIQKYGNFHSGIAASVPADHAAIEVGALATICSGRDRHPAKVADIVYFKSGRVKGYMLQRFKWTIDFDTEGYAKEIHWDQPDGAPSYHKVTTHGHLKGSVKDAFFGRADAFYDRSF